MAPNNQKINLKDIVLHIINRLTESKIYFGKTKIIKLAYLLEIEFFRINDERLSDADWIFYKFGPYPINYGDYLEQDNIIVGDDDYLQQISIGDDFELPSIPLEVKTLLSSIVMKFGDMEINELLNYVYFETEPMIHAMPRSKLDFSFIKKEIKEEIKKFHSRDHKLKIIEIQNRLSDKLSKLPEPRFQTRFISEDMLEDSDMNNFER